VDEGVHVPNLMTMQNKRLIGIFIAVALLLTIPLVAMRFTDEVKWTGLDFAAAGLLLLSAGLLCEFALRRVRTTVYRVVLCGGILFGLVMVWGVLATAD
jgi:hypothetical protein